MPIYLYSDVGERELENRARACGADGYIAKQWGIEGLVSTVQTIFDDRKPA